MPHHWIPNSSPKVREEMLNFLGIKDVGELFSDIPESMRFKGELKVGFGELTEYEARRKFTSIVKKNRVFNDPPPFLGGGVCAHYVPSAVKAILSRSEFYTAYTPYQPEIAQGLLQAFFEYQSLMAELYGVDIVNASLYNGSTAAAEAVRMALRVNRGRRSVVLASTAHPETREVIRTWVSGIDVNIVEAPFMESTGSIDEEKFKEIINDETAAVYLENPNFFGLLEKDLKSLVEIAHDAGSLVIIGSTPILLGVIKPPGELGADIVVGDAQPLGLGMNYGGPSAGIFGIPDRKELVRQLPGRLIGATTTVDGSRIGYTMILQTREQHIRRERATSNITTNSGLETVAAAVYISLLGASGIRKLGEAILGRTEYLISRLREVGIQAPYFPEALPIREVPIKLESGVEELIKELLTRNVHIGPPLGRFYPELSDGCLLCVTELHTKEDIDLLANSLGEVVSHE